MDGKYNPKIIITVVMAQSKCMCSIGGRQAITVTRQERQSPAIQITIQWKLTIIQAIPRSDLLHIIMVQSSIDGTEIIGIIVGLIMNTQQQIITNRYTVHIGNIVILSTLTISTEMLIRKQRPIQQVKKMCLIFKSGLSTLKSSLSVLFIKITVITTLI